MAEANKNRPVLSEQEKKKRNVEAHKRYMTEKHDYVELSIRMERSKREEINKYASSHDFESTADFARQAIDRAMEDEILPSN